MVVSEQKEKFLFLESLRGIAAAMIVFHHGIAFSQFNYTHLAFVKNAFLMVDFFFVLSGFVIAYNYSEKITSFYNLYVFQIRRFLRLYPLHLITLLMFLAFEVLKYLYSIKSGVDTGSFEGNNWLAFLHNLFLTHSIFLHDVTFNYPSWSISTEFYTYLIFAFTVLIFRSVPSLTISCIVVVLLCGIGMYYFEARDGFLAVEYRMLRCLYAFFLGVLVHLHYPKLVKLRLKYAEWIILLMIVTSIYLFDHFSRLIHPILFSMFIAILCLNKNSFLVQKLEQNILVYLGSISYGIYMWHAGVWWILRNVLRYGFDLRVTLGSGGEDLFHLGVLGSVSVTLVAFFATVAISHISYKWLEMPINNYRHHFLLRK